MDRVQNFDFEEQRNKAIISGVKGNRYPLEGPHHLGRKVRAPSELLLWMGQRTLIRTLQYEGRSKNPETIAIIEEKKGLPQIIYTSSPSQSKFLSTEYTYPTRHPRGAHHVLESITCKRSKWPGYSLPDFISTHISITTKRIF